MKKCGVSLQEERTSFPVLRARTQLCQSTTEKSREGTLGWLWSAGMWRVGSPPWRLWHLLFIHFINSPSFPPFSFPSSLSLLPTGSPAGKQVYDESGELVCTKPFPSMPTHFWNDEDGIKYTKAYFSVFQGEPVHQIDQFELLSWELSGNARIQSCKTSVTDTKLLRPIPRLSTWEWG